MLRRHKRLVATIASATLALGTSTLAGTLAGGAAAAPEPGVSPLDLWAPDRIVTGSYNGRVYTDFGLRLVAVGEPFELWSTRASYADPIVTEWRSSAGDVELPEGTMQDFSGLEKFLAISVRRVSDGTVAHYRRSNVCLNGFSQRISPEAPATSPYPWGCAWNPYTLGSVMGVEEGHAVSLMDEWGRPFRLERGKYDVTMLIRPAYATMLGIAPEQAKEVTRLIVKREGPDDFRTQRRSAGSPDAQPASHEPRQTRAVPPPGGPAPDLRSLPAFDVQLNEKGTALRFAATVWNAGNSPMVVDGFRGENEDHMDAYQYFYDSEGNQVGDPLAVGEMHWHAENHQHWHFEDFARYRLLKPDSTQAVKSTKQSFCLANTDAVDYTVDGANWTPENTDLGSDCGGSGAISVRQVLDAGSGDTYLQYRYGQAFPIKNVPNGVYDIAVEANPLGNLAESDETNNVSLRRIRIGGKPDRRWVKSFAVGIIEETIPGGLRVR